LWDTTLCRLVYIYLPIFLRIVQHQYPARTVRPFVCSSERNPKKFLCKNSRTIMGTGSEPGTVRILVQFVITAPRHSHITLPHKTRSCFTVTDTLLSFTCIHQVLKSQDIHCTYQCYIEARSRNPLCCGNAISITYSECVCSLCHPAYKAHAPCYIVICGLSGCTVFFHTI
jgi:hypothetical protein